MRINQMGRLSDKSVVIFVFSGCIRHTPEQGSVTTYDVFLGEGDRSFRDIRRVSLGPLEGCGLPECLTAHFTKSGDIS